MLNTTEDYTSAKTGTLVKDNAREWLKATNKDKGHRLSFDSRDSDDVFDNKEYWYPRAYSHEKPSAHVITDEQGRDDHYVSSLRRTDAEMAGKERLVYVKGKGSI